MSSFTEAEKKALNDDPELIELAESIIADGGKKFKTVKDVAAWAKAGRDPEKVPAAGEKTKSFIGRLFGGGGKRPAEGGGSVAKPDEEEGEDPDEEEEEEPGELPAAKKSERLLTETESVDSGKTAGTGNPLAAGAAATAPAPRVRDVRKAAGEPKKLAKKVDDWSEFVSEVLEGLTYVGFDTVRVREQVREDFTFKELLHVLSVYTKVGNNVKKRLKSGVLRSDDAASEAMDLIRDKGISAKVKGTSKLSLPRIAQAFCPILLVLRRSATSKLDKRVASTTPLELQDVAFGGYYPEADDYHQAFGRLLAKAAANESKTAYDEAAADLKNKGFRDLSKTGLERDTALARAIKTVVDWRTAEAWFADENFGEEY